MTPAKPVPALAVLLAAAPCLAQGTGDVPRKSLLHYINDGGPIGYVIIITSIVAVALAIIHFIQIRRERLAPPGQVDALSRFLRDGDVASAQRFCGVPDNDSFLTRVFAQALARCARSPFGNLEIRSALEEAGQQETERLIRSNDGVGLVASIAPMLGLLGTVVGMVGAFDTIGSSQGAARPSELAGNISVALITTVQGLIVAIPCTGLYAYMRNRTDRLATEAAQTIEAVAGELESSGARAKPPQPARPSPRPAPPQPAREGRPA